MLKREKSISVLLLIATVFYVSQDLGFFIAAPLALGLSLLLTELLFSIGKKVYIYTRPIPTQEDDRKIQLSMQECIETPAL